MTLNALSTRKSLVPKFRPITNSMAPRFRAACPATNKTQKGTLCGTPAPPPHAHQPSTKAYSTIATIAFNANNSHRVGRFAPVVRVPSAFALQIAAKIAHVPMSKKFYIFLVLVIAAAGLYLTREHWLGQGDDDLIETVAIKTGPLRMIVQTTGPLKPIKTVPVGSEVSGTMEWLGADYNDRVKAGDVIARLRTELYQARVAAAQAAHENSLATHRKSELALVDLRSRLPMLTSLADSAHDRAKAALDMAEYNWKRVEALHAADNAPEAEFRNARSAYQDALASVEAAKLNQRQAKLDEQVRIDLATQDVALALAAVHQAKASLDLATQELDRCTIKAPIDGFILKRLVSVGEPVISALTAQYVFIITPDLGKMQLQANVSESDIALVRADQDATFTVDACGDRPFAGKVKLVRYDPVTIQGVVTYQVMIDVDNPDGVLRPDMTANVSIEVVKRDSAPKVENSALRFKPPLSESELAAAVGALEWPRDAGGKSSASNAVPTRPSVMWQRDAKGRWHAVPVLAGITDNRETEIISGAKVGDSFVTGVKRRSGAMGIRDALRMANPGNRSI